MERFFWALTHERTNDETIYDPERLHQTLDYPSPKTVRSEIRPGISGVNYSPAGIRESWVIAKELCHET